jgi:hypothetical protein
MVPRSNLQALWVIVFYRAASFADDGLKFAASFIGIIVPI